MSTVLKTREKRQLEVKNIQDKLIMLDIYNLLPEEVVNMFSDHIENGTNYSKTIPWPEMKRKIRLILNNKSSIINRCDLLL